MVYQAPKKYEAIIDSVMDMDKAYFKEHPEATEYEREIIPGEFFPKHYPPGTKVRVVQLMPGMRQRQALSEEVRLHPEAVPGRDFPPEMEMQFPRSGKKRLKRRKRH